MVIVDFQILARVPDASSASAKSMNEDLFPSFEPVRLWLRENSVEAPFRKIVIELKKGPKETSGRVLIVGGICEISIHFADEPNGDLVRDSNRLGRVVLDACSRIALSTGWDGARLSSAVKHLLARDVPRVHFFASLCRTERKSGIECVPWLSMNYSDYEFGVRIGARDVVVASRQCPIYLEDEIPRMGSAVRSGHFQILSGPKKVVFASVPIRQEDLH